MLKRTQMYRERYVRVCAERMGDLCVRGACACFPPRICERVAPIQDFDDCSLRHLHHCFQVNFANCSTELSPINRYGATVAKFLTVQP